MSEQEKPDFTNLSYAHRHRDLRLERAEETGRLMRDIRRKADLIDAPSQAKVLTFLENWLAKDHAEEADEVNS